MLDFRSYNIDFPVIIGPNLGFPLILKYDTSTNISNLTFDLLVVAPQNATKDSLKKTLDGTIEIVPLLKLKFESGEEDTSSKNVAIRGDIIPLKLNLIEPIEVVPINMVKYLENDNYLNPASHFDKFSTFGNLSKYFKALVSFEPSPEVRELLKTRNFVMFDIVHKIPNRIVRTNFHSLVLSNQEWKDFTFIQATDIHIAKRNDEILEKIKITLTKKIRSKVKSFISEIRNKEVPPLEQRFINPNNQFRNLIKVVNEKVLNNELDFLVITGDIIDFCLISALGKLEDMVNFHLPNTNWVIFRDILLNQEEYYKPGMVLGEELLCPIFTIPGNHDFRLAHYDLRWGMMYKKIGLVLSEALTIFDHWVADPVRALTPLRICLINYWQEINPSLDYVITLGDNHLIFLNSGYDSGKDFRDLVWGSPSSTGMTSAQVQLLENFLNYRYKEGENVFLFSHGPVINPVKKLKVFQKLKRVLKFNTFIELDDLKESNLGEKEESEELRRIDNKIYLKHGTITNNWQEMINFCLNYCTLALCGHTHSLREFRLEQTNEKSRITKSVPFNLKKIENPAAVYYDDYSDLFQNSDDIAKNKPFILQTPALGLGSFDDPSYGGGYREIIVKKGKVDSFKVYFLPK